MSQTLFAELEYFRQKELELVASSPGKYVLIKDQSIIGFFDRQYEAIAEAYKRFGNSPFLVKLVIAR